MELLTAEEGRLLVDESSSVGHARLFFGAKKEVIIGLEICYECRASACWLDRCASFVMSSSCFISLSVFAAKILKT